MSTIRLKAAVFPQLNYEIQNTTKETKQVYQETKDTIIPYELLGKPIPHIWKKGSAKLISI
jgi:hypothetical protein